MLSLSSTLSPSKRVALVGMMVAVLEAVKFSLSFLANVELVTLFLILFALCFGKETYFAVGIFVVMEGFIYGFGIWWIMYLYIWPSLVTVARIFRRKESMWFWVLVSTLYGLTFGFFCSIPYLFVGGLRTAVSWWIAGIPYDLIHGTSNAVLALVLFYPLRSILRKIAVRIGAVRD